MNFVRVRNLIIVIFCLSWLYFVHKLIVETGLYNEEKPDVESLTSIVIMGYDTRRYKNYEKIFREYGAMDKVLDRVVFIWNNLEQSPPNVPKDTRVPIVLWRAPRNSMNNRYNATKFVRTESILSIDDDVLVNEKMITRLVKTFRNNKDRLIGVPPYRTFDDSGIYKTKRESYKCSEQNRCLCIGKTMIYHKKYADIYVNDPILTDWTDVEPCEDIAMNFLIRKESGHDIMKLEGRGGKVSDMKVKDHSYPFFFWITKDSGLSGHDDWYGPEGKRSRCIRWSKEHFGNPYQ